MEHWYGLPEALFTNQTIQNFRLDYNYQNEQHRFSEDYQASYYQATLAMADKIPFLAGTSPWILKDFRSPRRQNIYQQGWNRKGLLDENGNRKQAFSVLSDYYKKKAGE